MAKTYKDDITPYCPMDDCTCPYYNAEDDGRCYMFPETNDLPYNECDAFDGDDD